MGSQNPYMIAVGLELFGMLGLNALGAILGLPQCLTSTAKTLTILGISFNVLQFFGIISLIVLGLMKHK